MINVDVGVKKVMYVKNIIFGILLHVIGKSEKCLASTIDDSAITCDEIIESYNEETNFNENKAICKMQKFYILLVFLLITLALSIYVSIFCYLIKYQAKQKHLLPIHNTMNQNKFQIDDINQKQVIKSKIQT